MSMVLKSLEQTDHVECLSIKYFSTRCVFFLKIQHYFLLDGSALLVNFLRLQAEFHH